MAMTMATTKQMTMTTATATATTMTMTTPTTTMTMETMTINRVHTKTFILRMPSHVGIVPIGCNRCRRFFQNCFRLGGTLLFFLRPFPTELHLARLLGSTPTSRFKASIPLYCCRDSLVLPPVLFRRCLSAISSAMRERDSKSGNSSEDELKKGLANGGGLSSEDEFSSG